MRKPRAAKQRKTSLGGVSVETLFVVPLLMTLMTGAFEVSRAIYNYQIALSIAYEGARALSQIDYRILPSGCFNDDSMGYASQSTDPNIRPVMDRVNYLMTLQGAKLALDNRDIRAEIIRKNDTSQSSACYSADRVSTVAIRITGTYRPALFSFMSFPLTVDSWAYQLSNNLAFSSTVNPNPGGSCGGVTEKYSSEKSDASNAIDAMSVPSDGGDFSLLAVVPPKEENMNMVIADPCSK